MAKGPEVVAPTRDQLAQEIVKAIDQISASGSGPDFWETDNLIKAIIHLRRGKYAVGIELAQQVARHTRLKKIVPDATDGPMLTVAELRAELEHAISESG